MIVEYEQDTYNGNININYDHIDEESLNIEVSCGVLTNYVTYLQTRRYMHTRGIH